MTASKRILFSLASRVLPSLVSMLLALSPVATCSADVARPVDTQVMVYYFHGTVRCESCLFIEAVTEGTLKSEFPDELATGSLTWRSINIDHHENVHFVSDYTLGPNELVVVRTDQCGNKTWEKITGTWDLAADPGRLSVTVRNVVLKFLGKR